MSTKGKATAKPGKTTNKKDNAAKAKKRSNLGRLCSEMSKYVVDANDKEIIKRFKTTISSSSEEDITKSTLDVILKSPKEVEMNTFSESMQPYIKHYLFMIKRNKKTGAVAPNR